MSTISFKNVNKVYNNKVHAVQDFNLEVKDREFIVFVGPSGCGKSTTLRMIAGFEDITSGEIWIDDTCINTLAPKDRNIAMVFQNYALYPHMTVFDNIAFALKLRKVFLPVTEINVENPDYIKEREAAIEEAEQRITAEVALMKKQKKKRDEIKDYTFREKSALWSKLEEIDARYERPVLTFDSAKAEAIQKKIKEAKEAKDAGLVSALEQELNAVYEEKIVPAYTYRHYTQREIAAKVYETANIIGLVPYLKRKPAALSGGQRQRVALGRAIVRSPKVFLMDEPLSNLDAKLRVQTRSEISKIHDKVGATTIYVTHDQTEAMTMASRIVIMKDGVVQQIGTPKEVYETPADMFVGGFIGSPSMNFIRGTFDGTHFVFENGVDKLEMAQKDIDLLKRNNAKDVTLGIRPEHIFTVSDKTVTNRSSEFKINVDITELLGPEILVYGSLGGQRILAKLSSKNEVKVNDVVSCIFDEDCVHFFDSNTEKVIK